MPNTQINTQKNFNLVDRKKFVEFIHSETMQQIYIYKKK